LSSKKRGDGGVCHITLTLSPLVPPKGVVPREQGRRRPSAILIIVSTATDSGDGGPSTVPTPLFIIVVSPCQCEPLRAGCCGGEGVFGVS